MKDGIIVDGEKMYYEEAKEFSKDQISKMILSKDEDLIIKCLLSLGLYEQDLEYASQIIFSFAENNNRYIKGVALLGIGYLAMRGYKLPLHPTIELMQDGLDNEDAHIKGQAYTAACEIDMYLPEISSKLKKDFNQFYGISKEEVDALLKDEKDE